MKKWDKVAVFQQNQPLPIHMELRIMKKNKSSKKTFLVNLLFLLILAPVINAQDLLSQANHAGIFAEQQIKTWLTQNSDSTQHPERTEANGLWKNSSRSGWTSGFFSGCLWYLFEKTNVTDWKLKAERWTGDLESQKNNTGDHDVGFRIMSSFGNGFRLTGREDYRQVILTAANSLSRRFNSNIGCIRSWSWGAWNYPVIIDNMMNLELLFWAAANGGSKKLYNIAIQHARNTRIHHIREDGSTWHVVDFNDDGTIKWKGTWQGYDNESTWSRGQAWGIYGFTMTYRYTQNDTFLTTAIKLADYFIDNLPADFVPYSDFEAPDIPNLEKDASAAAIACAAFFELAQYTSHDKYIQTALNILSSLCSPNYLAEGKNYSSILHRASSRYHDPEKGLIYADYYFLEALRKFNAYTSKIEMNSSIVKDFVLGQNFPNPFNSWTVIPFSINRPAHLLIKIYNSKGQFIQTIYDAFHTPGNYSLRWEPRNLTSGTYIYRLEATQLQSGKKLIYLK